MAESRLRKSLQNARVNLIFYLITSILAFFSRKVFLDHLGADFVGLTSTIQNILGFLNLAEFGISSAIAFNLYKPIHDKQRERISDIITLYGWLYRLIGIIIIVAGIILSCFIPLIFENVIFDLKLIFFIFYSFLFSSLLGYFINYRQILLAANQQNYIIISIYQTVNFVKILCQMIIVMYYTNYYLWAAIEVVFAILNSIILNYKINKKYPWLKTDLRNGKKLLSENKNIVTTTKQIFVHKIKDFLLTQSDQIFIFIFVSLKMVAFYGNYSLIVNKVISLLTSPLNSFTASIGNLIAEDNNEKVISIFWELMSIRYFITGITIIILYYLTEPFIIVWLGEQYILDKDILILLLSCSFIMLSRGVVDSFLHAYGQYGDTWAAWTEGIINLTVTIIAAHYWGIIGILLGKLISLFFMIVIWKPLYLFKSGFALSVRGYWKRVSIYYFIFGFVAIAIYFINKLIPIQPYRDFISLSIYGVCIIFLSLIFSIPLFLIFAPGMLSALKRIPVVHKFFSK